MITLKTWVGMAENRIYSHKKLLVAGVLAGVFSIAIAAVFILQSASAQTNGTQSDEMMYQMPQINGSVNLQQQTTKLIQENVKVSFTSAASTAQSQVEGGTVIGGHLVVMQGYLVYVFNVASYDAGTSRIVIVDAGNGQVLHTSDVLPLQLGGAGFGGCPMGGGWHHGGYGMGWGGMHEGMMKPPTTSSGYMGNSLHTSAA